MVRLTLKFPNITADILEEKLKDAVEKFTLSAEYSDGEVIIIGSKEAIHIIQKAYKIQQMLSSMTVN